MFLNPFEAPFSKLLIFHTSIIREPKAKSSSLTNLIFATQITNALTASMVVLKKLNQFNSLFFNQLIAISISKRI